jgi:hypothetical protein
MKKKSNVLKTAALLELTGPFSSEDIAAKKTFEYYWANKCKYGLPFNNEKITGFTRRCSGCFTI